MKDEEVTPEHTAARVGQILEEIEALRLEMGRSRDARVPMHVVDASPREVFYHAQTIHRKANQLCVELGATSVSPPTTAEPGRARSADVLRVLDSTGVRLAEARVLLHLEDDHFEPPSEPSGPRKRDVGKQASDVLAGCLIASRQLNVMLGRAFTSREAHDLLIRALGLTEQFLASHGATLPPPPALERRKFPRDVFQVLWRGCETLHGILTGSGLAALDLRRGYVAEDPSDVYDLSSLIVSELEYVSSFLPGVEAPLLTVATPTPTLPVHNFRRARQLDAAFDTLATAVRARSDWLEATKG